MNGKYLHLNGFVQFSKSSINIYNRSYSPNPIIEPKEGIPINNLSLTNKTKIILDSFLQRGQGNSFFKWTSKYS